MLFPRGEDEMKAHITGRHWTCMVIRSSGRLKLGWFDWRLSISQGYASGYPSSPHLLFPPLRLTAGIHFKSLCPLPRKTFWQVVLWTAQIYFFLLQSQKYSLSVLLTLYVLDSDGFSRQTSWYDHTRGQIVLLLSSEMSVHLWRFPAFLSSSPKKARGTVSEMIP